MPRNDMSVPFRFKIKRADPAVAAPESEWRENMRDFALMASGVYQDLRGDSRESWRHFRDWIREGWRKLVRPNAD